MPRARREKVVDDQRGTEVRPFPNSRLEPKQLNPHRPYRLAKLLESEPDRQAAAAKAAEAKLEALNQEIRQLERAAGVEPSSSAGPVASGSGSGEPAKATGGAGTKRRLEDSKYVEESREIVSGVKDAVRAGTPLGSFWPVLRAIFADERGSAPQPC